MKYSMRASVLLLLIGLLAGLDPTVVTAKPLSAYPSDPTADIPMSPSYPSTLTDIQTAFNNARAVENAQLGKSIPMLTLPSQSAWDAMSDGEKAFWLINRERIDRGVLAMSGVESNVTSVAQSYANFLLANNVFSHYADGHDPWYRLNANPAIGGCHDFLSVAEDLAAFMTSGSSIPFPVEQAVYMWMYEDAPVGWGHRHAILWYPYNDNSGPSGQEGFLGIGRASGPYLGWNYGVVIVLNVFDPCSTWHYPSSTTTTLTCAPNPALVGQTVTCTATVSGSGGTPTGTCTFKDSGTTLGTGTLNGSGVATFTTSSLAFGSHSITAEYGGNLDFMPSTSSAFLQRITTPSGFANFFLPFIRAQ